MNVTSNCKRIPAHCRVCNKPTDVLQANYHAVDRNGDPIYPVKCCTCGGLNILVPLKGGGAIVSGFLEIPAELRDMMQKAVDRFGFNED